MSETPDEQPVASKSSLMRVLKLHQRFLRLSSVGESFACRQSSTLFMWLCELPTSLYPGTARMAAVLGSNRWAVARAEKELVDAGLVRFTETQPRTFEILELNKILRSQVDAYRRCMDAAESKKKPRTRKSADEPIIDSAPTNDVENGSGSDAKLTDPATTDPQIVKAKRTPLTPDDVAKICADLPSMTAYLLYGKPGVYATNVAHPPDILNWQQFQKSEVDLGVAQWEVHQFVGYYWFQVSNYRAQRGLELTLPAFSKLHGIFKNLLKQVTKQRLLSIITFVVYYFDVIRWMLRRAGNTVYLDEGALVNPLVQQSGNNLMGMSEVERQSLVDQFKVETGIQ